MSRLRPTDDALDAFRLAPGFETASVACGLKPSGAPDLLMVWSADDCAAAGVFTTNRVQAAPVTIDRERLAAGAARMRGVIANAGCANAVTGDRGMADARRMAALGERAAAAPEGAMLVLSTGVIGRFLDMAKLERGVASLLGPGASRRAGDAARAITTTDTHAKIAAATATIGGRAVSVAGFAKGAGMIHPNMATLLAVLTTDVAAAPAALDRSLRRAVALTFNRISVDGDTSTNDTVLLLTSGASGAPLPESGDAGFDAALLAVCTSLAKQVAADGEGATRLVELRVTGAADEAQAHRVGDAIARSPLVKTAIHGADPNWGRVLAAAGYSGAAVDPARVRLWFGEGDALQLLARGLPLPFDEGAASALLREDPVVLRLDLGLGAAAASLWTCDFSADYIRINADYTT